MSPFLLESVASVQNEVSAGGVVTAGKIKHKVRVELRGNEAILVPGPLLIHRIGSAGGLLLPDVQLELVLRDALWDVEHEARIARHEEALGGEVPHLIATAVGLVQNDRRTLGLGGALDVQHEAVVTRLDVAVIVHPQLIGSLVRCGDLLRATTQTSAGNSTSRVAGRGSL